MTQCIRKEKNYGELDPVDQKRSHWQMCNKICNQAYVQRVV